MSELMDLQRLLTLLVSRDRLVRLLNNQHRCGPDRSMYGRNTSESIRLMLMIGNTCCGSRHHKQHEALFFILEARIHGSYFGVGVTSSYHIANIIPELLVKNAFSQRRYQCLD